MFIKKYFFSGLFLALLIFLIPRISLAGDGEDCFIAGTPITMSDGTTKNIEDIAIGDKVKTVDIGTMKVESNFVEEISSPIHSNMVRLTFENGENKNTFDHPYYVKGKGFSSYKPELTQQRYGFRVASLEVGDTIYRLNDDNELIEEKLLNITEEIKEVQTYNLHRVANNHNFFAGGILVHNKDGTPCSPSYWSYGICSVDCTQTNIYHWILKQYQCTTPPGGKDTVCGDICVDYLNYQTVACTGGDCVADPCSLPWGGTIASGSSVTAYASPVVACGSTCSSQTRTCINGILSGTYTNQSCSVTLPSCGNTLDYCSGFLYDDDCGGIGVCSGTFNCGADYCNTAGTPGGYSCVSNTLYWYYDWCTQLCSNATCSCNWLDNTCGVSTQNCDDLNTSCDDAIQEFYCNGNDIWTKKVGNKGTCNAVLGNCSVTGGQTICEDKKATPCKVGQICKKINGIPTCVAKSAAWTEI